VLVKVTGAVATGLLVAGGAAVLAQSGTAQSSRIAQDQGGLAVAPLKVDRPAETGATNTVTVANRSKEALSIEVKARSWTQSSSTGDVAPNRRSSLAGVRVDGGTFSLAPGQSRNVNVVLAGAPAGGSLYGALEVVGLPADIDKRKGLVTGYRLVGALRYQPATKRYALKASNAKVSGGKLVLPVRSTGNTNAVVSASAEIKGATGTKRGSARAAILPGKRVNLGLLSSKNLRAGSYTVKVRLKQGTLSSTVTKKIRVKAAKK
jgi:hypothetical protein